MKWQLVTSKHALPLMRRVGGGSIINFGSYDGFIADPNLAAYCATKGAVHALTRAMACDHGPDDIRVNAICPGYVDTPMLKSFFDAKGDAEAATMRDEARLVHPLRRYGTPEEWRTSSTGSPATRRATRPGSYGSSTAASPPRCSRCASEPRPAPRAGAPPPRAGDERVGMLCRESVGGQVVSRKTPRVAGHDPCDAFGSRSGISIARATAFIRRS